MRLHRQILFTVAALQVALFVTPSAHAISLSNRVFVSQRSGNDANACNNILTPCQTFAGAVLQLNPGGEAIVLDSGGYGPVTITQSLTIEAPAGVTAFIHPPSGDAITVNAGATDTVILRGLTLNGGTGNGITVNTVGQFFVEHCTITGYGGDGIHFVAPGGTLFMRDDSVHECAGSGVFVTSGTDKARAVIRESYFGQNAGYGVWASDNSGVAVTDCLAAFNNTGFRIDASSVGHTDMTLERSQAISNRSGIFAETTAGAVTIRFAYCLVTQNTSAGVVVGLGATILGSSPGTSVVAGNNVDIVGGLGAMTLQ